MKKNLLIALLLVAGLLVGAGFMSAHAQGEIGPAAVQDYQLGSEHTFSYLKDNQIHFEGYWNNRSNVGKSVKATFNLILTTDLGNPNIPPMLSETQNVFVPANDRLFFGWAPKVKLDLKEQFAYMVTVTYCVDGQACTMSGRAVFDTRLAKDEIATLTSVIELRPIPGNVCLTEERHKVYNDPAYTVSNSQGVIVASGVLSYTDQTGWTKWSPWTGLPDDTYKLNAKSGDPKIADIIEVFVVSNPDCPPETPTVTPTPPITITETPTETPTITPTQPTTETPTETPTPTSNPGVFIAQKVMDNTGLGKDGGCVFGLQKQGMDMLILQSGVPITTLEPTAPYNLLEKCDFDSVFDHIEMMSAVGPSAVGGTFIPAGTWFALGTIYGPVANQALTVVAYNKTPETREPACQTAELSMFDDRPFTSRDEARIAIAWYSFSNPEQGMELKLFSNGAVVPSELKIEGNRMGLQFNLQPNRQYGLALNGQPQHDCIVSKTAAFLYMPSVSSIPTTVVKAVEYCYMSVSLDPAYIFHGCVATKEDLPKSQLKLDWRTVTGHVTGTVGANVFLNDLGTTLYPYGDQTFVGNLTKDNAELADKVTVPVGDANVWSKNHGFGKTDETKGANEYMFALPVIDGKVAPGYNGLAVTWMNQALEEARKMKAAGTDAQLDLTVTGEYELADLLPQPE